MLSSLFLCREFTHECCPRLLTTFRFTRTGSYPTVSQHTGTWSLNASTHSLDWSIPLITSSDPDSRTGTLEFTVGGDDAATFFPVRVGFIAEGSLFGIGVGSVKHVESGNNVEFSQDVTLSADDYLVV